MSYLVGAYKKEIDRSAPKMYLSDVPLELFVSIRLAREICQVDVDYSHKALEASSTFSFVVTQSLTAAISLYRIVASRSNSCTPSCPRPGNRLSMKAVPMMPSEHFEELSSYMLSSQPLVDLSRIDASSLYA